MKSSKKKIAFVIGAMSPGGAERVITNLCNSLYNDFEITIITFIEAEPFYPLNETIKVISCYENLPQPKSFIDSFILSRLQIFLE